MTDRPTIPPFSRPTLVADIGDDPLMLRLEANEVERAALAREAGVPAIGSLVADLELIVERHETVHVTGRVRARATRECVVTLEPFEEKIDEEVDVTFAPEETVAAAEARFAAASEEDAGELPDPPDTIENGRIDLGALVAEFFVLGLDPYPRKPGVTFEAPNPPAEDERESPFAALARLKPEPPSKP